jgi:hypothetical protein
MRNGITLTPNVSYSPAPSAVMRFMNEQSNDDEIKFCDFSISEESRMNLEGDHPSHQPRIDPNPPPLTPSKNSLMFGEQIVGDDDTFEAISALNALSNSPFRPKKRPQPEESKKEGKKEEKKSLFATVVGGINKQKDPKKKLTFE